MDLVADVYSLTRRFPADERFGLAAHLRKSAVSIPSNIAEGWGRNATREYIQFLRYARGSLKEAETQWLLAVRVGHVTMKEVERLDRRAERLGRMLLRLVRTLQRQ